MIEIDYSNPVERLYFECITFFHILVAWVYMRILKKTVSQLKLPLQRYRVSKMAGIVIFHDVSLTFCLPVECLPCLTSDVDLTLSFVSRYIISDVNGMHTYFFSFPFFINLYIVSLNPRTKKLRWGPLCCQVRGTADVHLLMWIHTFGLEKSSKNE